jgi:hypothetical protein
MTWTQPLNLTKSLDMDDRYPYISSWNEAGKINVLYQTDTKAGSIADGGESFIGDVDHLFLKFEWPETGVKEKQVPILKGYALHQNFPNPFNPTTTIQFRLPKDSHVQLTIYNMLGQKMLRLVNEKRSVGIHSINWDGLDKSGNAVSAGIYFYQLQAKGFVTTKKMIMAK